MRPIIGTIFIKGFNLITKLSSYGVAVALFSVLFAGTLTLLDQNYLIQFYSRFYDYTADQIWLIRVLFILPFPTAAILYGGFHRLGVPALLPSFRVANRYINVYRGVMAIKANLAGDQYQALLRAINRLPVIFAIVGAIEVGYIGTIMLSYSLYHHHSAPTIGWLFFAWVGHTFSYGGIGYLLGEIITGKMRSECKRKIRRLGLQHEIKTKFSLKFKLVFLSLMFLLPAINSIWVAYLSHEHIWDAMIYIVIFMGVFTLLVVIIGRTFYLAIHDTETAMESLKERGEGVMYASGLDREIVELAIGINVASDTITDYRKNLELKVEERTKELSDAKEEIEAAMVELGAMNDNLSEINRELEDSNVRYKKDLAMAGSVQHAFLPRTPPSSNEYDIAFEFRPMAEVSGDFYDFYTNSDAVEGVGIFDVSGHGISSGLLTLVARSIIYRNFMNNHDEKLGRVMNSINKSLIGEIGQTGYYITGILLRFKNSMVEYVNSGHPNMMYKTAESKIVGQVLAPDGDTLAGPFLGVPVMDHDFQTLTIKSNPGDCLLLFTDSLVETTGPAGEPFGEDRILIALKDAPGGAAQDILDYIMKQFYDFTKKMDALNDDCTVVVIKKKHA